MSTEPTPPLTRKQIIALERATAASPQPSEQAPEDVSAPEAASEPTPAAPQASEFVPLPVPAAAAVGVTPEPAAAAAPEAVAPAVTPAEDSPETLRAAPGPESPAQIPEPTTASEPGPAASSINEAPEATAAEAPKRRLPAPLRWIFSALVIVVLCASILIGLAAIVVPAVGGGTALTVQTSSMEPHYPAGTMVVIRPIKQEDIKPGDVITYQLKSGEDAVVTHRVTQQLRTADGGYLFITQGDNNPSADPEPIQHVQIRGKLWYAIPWVGWIANATNGPWRSAVLPLVVGALFAYAAWMFLSSMRDKRRKEAATDSSAAASKPDA